MEKTKGWLLVAGVLIIVLGVTAYTGYLVVSAVRDTTQNTLGPVNEISGAIGTQVSQVLHPTPTVIPDPITIIHEVRSLARLETIQYTLEKVITVESGQGPFGFLFGDKLLFVAHGSVIAGVDLAQLQSEDMWVEEDTLYVALPEAEVFVTTLDNDKSYVYDRETGVLTKGQTDLEATARQAAEEEILNAALEDGILEQARINAEAFLLRLLTDLGFPNVIFVDQGSNGE